MLDSQASTPSAAPGLESFLVGNSVQLLQYIGAIMLLPLILSEVAVLYHKDDEIERRLKVINTPVAVFY